MAAHSASYSRDGDSRPACCCQADGYAECRFRHQLTASRATLSSAKTQAKGDTLIMPVLMSYGSEQFMTEAALGRRSKTSLNWKGHHRADLTADRTLCGLEPKTHSRPRHLPDKFLIAPVASSSSCIAAEASSGASGQQPNHTQVSTNYARSHSRVIRAGISRLGVTLAPASPPHSPRRTHRYELSRHATILAIPSSSLRLRPRDTTPGAMACTAVYEIPRLVTKRPSIQQRSAIHAARALSRLLFGGTKVWALYNDKHMRTIDNAVRDTYARALNITWRQRARSYHTPTCSTSL